MTITVDYQTTIHLMALSNAVSFIQSDDGAGIDGLATWVAHLRTREPMADGWRKRIIDSTLAARGWADGLAKSFIENGACLPIRWEDDRQP